MSNKTTRAIRYERLQPGAHSLPYAQSLNELFAHVFEDDRNDAKNCASDEDVLSFLADPNHIVCIAIAESRVVGGAVAYVLDMFARKQREVNLYDLAVYGGYRRMKIATNLISFLRDTATALGATGVFVQAEPEDRPAVALYNTLGVRNEVDHFDIHMQEIGNASPSTESRQFEKCDDGNEF